MTTHIRMPALAAALVALALALAACGTETIDAGSLETELADQLATQAGVDASDVSVECPSDQEAEQGNTFDCTLTAPNGDEVTVNVELTNDEGGFEANVPQQQFEE